MSATRASNDRPPGAGGVKRGRLQQEAAATGSRVTVVLGAQWGDEGKGKVVDLLATDADIISRCQVRRGGPPPNEPLTQADPAPALPPGLRHASWMPSLPGTPSQRPPTPTDTHTALTLPSLHGTPSPTPSQGPTPTPALSQQSQRQSYKYESC